MHAYIHTYYTQPPAKPLWQFRFGDKRVECGGVEIVAVHILVRSTKLYPIGRRTRRMQQYASDSLFVACVGVGGEGLVFVLQGLKAPPTSRHGGERVRHQSKLNVWIVLVPAKPATLNPEP